MRELFQLHAGQCGIALGNAFWTSISKEHGLDPQGHFVGDQDFQVRRLPVFYDESACGRYVPRAVFFDTEPGILNVIRTLEWGSLYHPDSFIFGRNSAGNNFAKGYYGQGAALSQNVIESVRKNVELAECLSGFQFTHGLGGGTGSGTVSILASRLRDEFPERTFTTYSAYPAKQVSEVVVEPYNTVLCTHNIIESIDQTICVSNEKVYNVCVDKLKIPSPDYVDLNNVMSFMFCGITSSLRFPGKCNVDLRKIAVNLVPFPRLHFYCGALAPLISKSSDDYVRTSVAALTQQCFDPNNILVDLSQSGSTYISCCITYRGNVTARKVLIQTGRIQQQYSGSFAPWVPNNIKSGIVNVSHQGFEKTATMFGNNLGIRKLFQEVNENFKNMLNRKAFLHWYLDNGMEIDEFHEASQNVTDLAEQMASYSGSENEKE